MDAVLAGEPAAIDAAIAAGSNFDAIDVDGDTPLMVAIANNELQCAGALLRHGADPNMLDGEGQTPLLRAIEGVEPKLVQLLCQSGADPYLPGEDGLAPIFMACVGYELRVRHVTIGFDDEGDFGMIPIESDNPRSGGIYEERRVKSREMIRALLDAGVDIETVHSDGDTALGVACYIGYGDLAKFLLECGASANGGAHPPLHLLFQSEIEDQEEMAALVALLLDAGANANFVCEGVSPLQLARQSGHDLAAEKLLEHGAEESEDDEIYFE